MRSKITSKRYPINQSPLFRIRGKGQFEKAIGVNWDAINKLLSQDNYRVWLNDKQREIQQPIGWLENVHHRIAKLFSRIELPDYVYSQKGRSYVDNARQHLGNTPLLKTDISKFYPSTKWQMVFEMFVQDFQCAKDVAQQLANICCYQQKHLPTGSPLSGHIAYFAASHMFEEISETATLKKCRMTVYVDDITVSGHAANKKMLGEIRRIISKQGLKTKECKSKTYSSSSAKTVTGTVVVGRELRLPNRRHQKIWEARKQLAIVPVNEKSRALNQLKGRLQEASQIFKLNQPDQDKETGE